MGMDAFKDRLSERARDTSRPALAHQCRGRALHPRESALAEALMEVYRTGTHDPAAVAAALAAQGIVAPLSGRTDWTGALLAEELAAINADLDAAYAEHGYGA
ncbi:recombinase-like helix-turn-helix domain-containing protein [Ruixingdingia sedimenti]|nr:recombinase-like helix-turn-helix domain-containing protein [Xinfangfangia sp. LG-4]